MQNIKYIIKKKNKFVPNIRNIGKCGIFSIIYMLDWSISRPSKAAGAEVRFNKKSRIIQYYDEEIYFKIKI